MPERNQHWRNRLTGGIVDVPPDQLVPSDLNFRRHPGTQQDALSGVINEIGYLDPVLVQAGTDRVIDGHLRVELAMRTGQPTIPVQYVDLTDAEADLALATFDPISAMAYHDDANLQALLAAVSTEDEAVQALLDSLAPEVEIVNGGLTDPDDVPEPPVDPITKPGDLWVLGRHRLLCGDSTVESDVRRLMAGERADMVFTDPPYAIYGSSTGVASDIADDKMIRPFLRDVLNASTQVSKAFAHVYICCDWRSYATWVDMAKQSSLSLKGCMVWDKGDGGLGGMYQQCHEFVAFLSNDNLRNSALMSGRATGQRTVNGKPNIWRFPRVSGDEREHNAAKPVGMIANALDASSDTDALVLDLFGGSGSTLIACEQTGRRCAMMELDPVYCDVIVRRWEQFTGEQAHLERVEAMAAD